MRILKTVLIVIGIYAAAILFELVFVMSSPDYEGGVTILVILGFLAFMAPKVGYLWFDCFFAAIPLYGIFFIFLISHRIAFLPERDWSQRTN